MKPDTLVVEIPISDDLIRYDVNATSALARELAGTAAANAVFKRSYELAAEKT